jgi:hypothetical protein
VEIVENTFYGYTVKDIDTGELFFNIGHKLLLHFEVFALVSAKVRLTGLIIDAHQKWDALLAKRRVIHDRLNEKDGDDDGP